MSGVRLIGPRHACALLIVVIATHLLTVWAAPYAIMQMLFSRSAKEGLATPNQTVFPAAVSAASRSIVMPSPEMLYSLCRFDLSGGPVHISANPALPTYWSIALYGANSDNFFVQNDRQSAGKPVDLWLVAADTAAQAAAAPPGARLVLSPSAQGLLLMRVLAGDYAAEKHILEPARRTLNCTAYHA